MMFVCLFVCIVQLIGVAQGCFDHTFLYLQEREQFGQKIYSFQVEVSIADSLYVLRALVYIY